MISCLKFYDLHAINLKEEISNTIDKEVPKKHQAPLMQGASSLYIGSRFASRTFDAAIQMLSFVLTIADQIEE